MTFIVAHEEDPGVGEVSGWVHSAAQGPFSDFRGIKKETPAGGQLGSKGGEGRREIDTISHCLLSTHVAGSWANLLPR